jgi:hypothetical protein
MPVIPALGELRQEDQKFKASLYFMVRPCPKKKKERKFSFLYYTYFFKVGTISSSLSYKFSHLFNRVLLSWNLFLVGSEVKKMEKQSK